MRLSPKRRSFFDTKNFLYYWHVSADRRMIFGGRASFMPTSIDHTARILHKGLLEVHPQLADYKRPRAYRFVDELPLTATGKKVHYQVRDQARADSAAGLLVRP